MISLTIDGEVRLALEALVPGLRNGLQVLLIPALSSSRPNWNKLT
jgi:hypothetical protein